METKKCTRCGEEKYLVEFSKRSASKDGFQPMCKACVCLYKKEYYEKNKNNLSDRAKVYRKDNNEYVKNIERQRRSSKSEQYRAMRKAYREANRDRVREWKRESYLRNREYVLEQQRTYRSHHKPDRDVVNAKNARRRASKLKATPSWADTEHITSLYLIAALCKEKGYDVHVDHIVPLNSDLVCGLHCEANLQLLYAYDNISKGNRHWPDMW